MTKPKSHIEIAYESIPVFADDGQLDVGEINFLLGLALRDNAIDDDERRVLAKIFAEAQKSTLTPAVQSRIDEVRALHNIPTT